MKSFQQFETKTTGLLDLGTTIQRYRDWHKLYTMSIEEPEAEEEKNKILRKLKHATGDNNDQPFEIELTGTDFE